MKAIVCTKYGSPDVLELKEVEKPSPNDDEVLINIYAASLNAADFEYLRGAWSARIVGPLKPRYKILGSDIAGRVETVGRNIEQFQPGDEVFGDSSLCGFGAFAEYVCVPENALALKPATMTYEEVATYPQAAIVALQGLREKRPIQPEQKVLINGAGGGMGTFAVQIAKSFGAEVTGVDSTRKLDMLRSIGADHVIDYTKENYTKNGQHYDLILDVQAHHSIFDYKRALSPEGIYVMVGGSRSAIFQALILGPLISRTGSKRLGINTGSKRMGIDKWKPNIKEDLDFLKDLFEAGKVIPIIDKRYPLSEVPEAFRYLEERRALGKVIITMENNNKT